MRLRKSRLNCSDEQIVNAYKSGSSLSEIARCLPVSIVGAWKILKMYGVKSKPTSHIGKNHPAWKGAKVGYVAIHSYITRWYGKPQKCENKDCLGKSKVFEWANIRGHKYSRKREDYLMLCRSCHRLYDYGKIKLP